MATKNDCLNNTCVSRAIGTIHYTGMSVANEANCLSRVQHRPPLCMPNLPLHDTCILCCNIQFIS